MRPFARYIAVEKGGRMPVGMHGEIYGDVEYGQQNVYEPGAEDCRAGRGSGSVGRVKIWDGGCGDSRMY